MKLNRTSTYVLVYLLTSRIRNLLVPVRAGETGSTGAGTKTGVDLSITSDTKSTDTFDYKKVGNYVTYSAKDKHAFKLVKDGDVKVWEASDNNYSRRIEVEHMSTEARGVTVFLADDKNKVFVKYSGDESFKEVDLSKVNPKTVNIGYEHESFFYKNELKVTVRTFTVKKGFAFKGANDYVDGEKVQIWKTDKENEYANKIEIEGGKKLTIHIGQGDSASTKVIEKGSDGRWPGTVKGVVLNIKAKNGCSEYYYGKDGKTVTFTIKGNRGFKTVKSKKEGCCNSCGGGTGVTIWDAKDATEYATKVVLDGKGKNEKTVTIYLPNDTKKVFKRDGKNKPWNDVSPQPKDSAKTSGTTPAGGAS